jgi:hypothetical protein
MHCQFAKQFHKNKMVNLSMQSCSRSWLSGALEDSFLRVFEVVEFAVAQFCQLIKMCLQCVAGDPCARILQGKRRQTCSGDYQLRIDLVEFLKLRIHPQSGVSTGAHFGKLTSASFTLCTSSLNCVREIRMQECGVWNHSFSETKEVSSQAHFNKQD